MTPEIETIYNLVCKHFPNDENFQRFYREFSKYMEELDGNSV